MNTTRWKRRVLALYLVFAMLAVQCCPVFAAGAENSTDASETLPFKESGYETDTRMTYRRADAADAPLYAETDMVRVSIILDGDSALDAGYSLQNILNNQDALRYQSGLEDKQEDVISQIEDEVLDGNKLDVVWNLTLAANLISANIQYGKVGAIEQLDGVSRVIVETPSRPLVVSRDGTDPLMATSSDMTGVSQVWAAGYTGAGTRIAVIDTGIDLDHQSFSGEALEHSLEAQKEARGAGGEAWYAGLDLLDEEELEGDLSHLHVYRALFANGWDADDLYQNEKVPFAFNYADESLEVTHDNDSQGEHGSHVAGIAAANSCIPDGKGGYCDAMETVKMQGAAPDAQILVMKVFGRQGGGYESDYMAAIEDAFYLGADVVNLSLGTSNPGFSRSEYYDSLMDKMASEGLAVITAAGNAGSWADMEVGGNGTLDLMDVSLDMVGSPASLVNSLAVASADNRGITDYCVKIGDSTVYYTDNGETYDLKPFLDLKGEHGYVMIDGVGTEKEFAAVADALSGKIAVCRRGEINFAQKADHAHQYGAIGLIVYNNTDGSFTMDMTGHGNYDMPCVSVSMAVGDILRTAAEKQTGEGGDYYVGSLTVTGEVNVNPHVLEHDTVSSFSSWGVPGSLNLKPEIMAPGGNIYSVNGSVEGGTAYENMSGTSMASPQIAGMTALLVQYLEEADMEDKTGHSIRQLSNSLLMSTAEPVSIEGEEGRYYPVLQQGAGLANVNSAISSGSCIWMDEDAASGADDGKVKVELGDDPDRSGVYNFGFTISNFTEEEQKYVLSSELFTQDVAEGEGGSQRLGKMTHSLAQTSTYVLSGDVSEQEAFSCDVNHDGKTDRADAQAILDYAVKLTDSIDSIADLNGDGEVTTADAHLHLAMLETLKVTVAPGAEVHVSATVSLTDSAKNYLDNHYENGAYIEGYFFLKADNTGDNALLPEHSIPILGYYGNWSDPSMFDRSTFTEALYGEEGFSYMGVNDIEDNATYSNYISLRHIKDQEDSIWTVNPYRKEEARPLEKASVNSRTLIYSLACSLIRDASSVLFFMENESGDMLTTEELGAQVSAGFYYDQAQEWVNNVAEVRMLTTPSQMGLEEGDTFTLGFLAVPEYYEKGGPLTVEQVLALRDAGVLGEGVEMSQSFTIDDTAPEAESFVKDEAGNLVVRVSDNQGVAAVLLLNSGGTETLDTAATEKHDGIEEAVLDLTGYTDSVCKVLVGDYAGNEKLYDVEIGASERENAGGQMFAFTNKSYHGAADSWLRLDRETLALDTSSVTGVETVSRMDFGITAAEYVGGFVFMAGEDGRMYVAEQGDWEEPEALESFREMEDGPAIIRDMAYNYSDHTLYALGGDNSKEGFGNRIYSVDMSTGSLTLEYTVSIQNPAEGAGTYNQILVNLAIDDEGNFYAVSSGYSSGGSMIGGSTVRPEYVYLYSWRNEQATDGQIEGLEPVDPEHNVGEYYSTHMFGSSYSPTAAYQSMAWDHDEDVLYWASSQSDIGYLDKLVVFRDPAESGVAEDLRPEEDLSGVVETHLAGLYIVPLEDDENIPAADEATELTIDKTQVKLLPGTEFTLHAKVGPWNLKNKSVIWSSSDDSVVTVKNGVITAEAEGTAVVTATSAVTDSVSATCEVTVEALPDISFSALMTQNGQSVWADFHTGDLKNPIKLGDSVSSYIAGTLLEDTIYVHDGSRLYGVDADDFEVRPYTEIDMTWNWSDAAPAPLGKGDGLDGKDSFGDIVGLVDGIDGGTSIAVMNAETGMGDDMATRQIFYNDRAVVIAYKESGTVEDEDEYGYDTWTCPARIYYVMTESGELWEATVYETYDLDYDGMKTSDEVHHFELKDLGPTGLDLGGVSNIYGGQYASMLYDEASGYLLVSVYTGGKTTKLYALDPEFLTAAEVGDFGSGVKPVVALYQYDMITDLTVKVRPSSAELNLGETMQLTGKAYPVSMRRPVVWNSEAESVATVTQDGMVTAVGEGTTRITATCGEASAACTVTVRALADLPAGESVKAHVTKSDGSGAWVSIALDDLTVKDLATDNRAYGGAAAYGGKLYASQGIWLYEIDPQNGYQAKTGDTIESGWQILDGSAAVPDEVRLSYTDEETWEQEQKEVSVPGAPIYVSDGEMIVVLEDYADNTTIHGSLVSGYEGAAMTWMGGRLSSEGEFDEQSYVQEWILLGADGYLWKIYRRTYLDGEGNPQTTPLGIGEELCNLHHTFADGTKLTMTRVKGEKDGLPYDGLLIVDAGEISTVKGTEGITLYWVDLSEGLENAELRKAGVLPEVTDIVGLHTDMELKGDFVDSYAIGYEAGQSAAQADVWNYYYDESMSEEDENWKIYNESYEEGWKDGWEAGYEEYESGYEEGKAEREYADEYADPGVEAYAESRAGNHAEERDHGDAGHIAADHEAEGYTAAGHTAAGRTADDRADAISDTTEGLVGRRTDRIRQGGVKAGSFAEGYEAGYSEYLSEALAEIGYNAGYESICYSTYDFGYNEGLCGCEKRDLDNPPEPGSSPWDIQPPEEGENGDVATPSNARRREVLQDIELPTDGSAAESTGSNGEVKKDAAESHDPSRETSETAAESAGSSMEAEETAAGSQDTKAEETAADSQDTKAEEGAAESAAPSTETSETDTASPDGETLKTAADYHSMRLMALPRSEAGPLSEEKVVGGSVEIDAKNTAPADGIVEAELNSKRSTNGLVGIKYDPQTLTFLSLVDKGSSDGLLAYRLDETEGDLTIGYASAAAYTGTVTDVDFAYPRGLDEEMETQLSLFVKEIGSVVYEEPKQGKVAQVQIPAEYTLTVHYLNGSGNAIADDEISYYQTGEEYTVSVKDVSGYEYVRSEGDALNGVMDQDREVTLIYRRSSSGSRPSTGGQPGVTENSEGLVGPGSGTSQDVQPESQQPSEETQQDKPLVFLAPDTGDRNAVEVAMLFALLALGMMGVFGFLGFKKNI